MAQDANSKPQLFISYSHVDNERPPLAPAGWVDHFDQALTHELRQRGLRCVCWRDLSHLRPDTFFDPAIEAEVDKSVVFVAVVSPNYVESDYCRRELDQFTKTGDTPAKAERVMKVVKFPVDRHDPDARLPESLRRRIGFQFFKIDRETGEEVHYWDAGAPRSQFHDKIRELVRSIEMYLPQRHQPSASAPVPSPAAPVHAAARPVVYLAEPSADLDDAHRSVKGELETKLGARVVPARALPVDETKALAEIDAALAEASFSLHLLGQKAGYIPDGDLGQSIVALQLERAKLRSASASSFRRLIWTAPGLAPADPRQKALLDGLRQEGALLASDDFVEETLERFKSHAIDRIRGAGDDRAGATSLTVAPVLFLVCAEEDEDQALALRQRMQGEGIEVRLPEFKVSRERRDEAFARHAKRADGYLVLFGAADESWVFEKLDDLGDWRALGRKRDFLSKGVLVTGEVTARKRSFFSPQARTVMDEDVMAFVAAMKQV